MLTVCSGPIFVDPVFLERPRSSWLVLYFWIRRGCGAPGSADYSYRSQLEYFLSIYLELRGGAGGGGGGRYCEGRRPCLRHSMRCAHDKGGWRSRRRHQKRVASFG